MPQNEYIERHIALHGRRFDHEIRTRKKMARAAHTMSKKIQKMRGLKAKIFRKRRYAEKIDMKKQIKNNEEKESTEQAVASGEGAIPAYLLERGEVNRTKILSNMIKQKRKEKAGKWDVLIPKVRQMNEAEMFRVMKSGKRKKKQWKRVVDKVCFIPEDYTRKPPKYEKYIRPTGLRFKKAHVTHPELKTTFFLDIISVKKNPQSNLYTSLGVITKGTIIEVNVSELGLVTQTGKVVWAKYAQVTNNPENDGCINAVLLV
ncbi:Ribosome biogenesis protein NSA2 -like protein [Babesia sp. Xinjiang]|uniref:Ribosome biogenesis protein NSA2 -like protein n=1 Tax=Babesia sp. Xinjiang TaxID=462227 RepID=UPI000A244001|nr:Ribosome biogenesis protein NSA2 -like protein [Babesia sp. Xinjiang]ORM40762.1 Ribosome biogenesis protein NSA2 -like protein [Babesia sp. Xinjiang]